MTVAAVILARLDSTRLPGKVLRSVGGRPLADYVLDACRLSGADQIVLATTDRAVDDPLAAWADAAGITTFRGSADDVAGRFLGALAETGAEAAVRVNGDSPLHRGALLALGVDTWRAQRPDLVTNVPGRTWPFGTSVEVVSRDAMARACEAMTEPGHREHVTAHLYDHPDRFHLHQLPSGPPAGRGVDLAVDDDAGLARFAAIAERLGDRLATAELTELLEIAASHQGPPEP